MKYAGGSFGALGGGVSPGSAAIDSANVDALAVDGTDLDVGTDDTDVAGIPQADFVVKWDGVAWSALGADTAGTDGFIPDTPATEIGAVTVIDGNLYATGRWINADGVAVADNVGAYADGTWRTLGSNGSEDGPWLGIGYAVAGWRGALVVVSGFVDAGGDLDADRLAAYPPADVARPTTSITARPAATVRTAKPKAKVTYKFRGTDPGFWPSLALRFQCKIDAAAYKPCSSPYSFKAAPGRHSFKVRAVDGAGNVDASRPRATRSRSSGSSDTSGCPGRDSRRDPSRATPCRCPASSEQCCSPP